MNTLIYLLQLESKPLDLTIFVESIRPIAMIFDEFKRAETAIVRSYGGRN